MIYREDLIRLSRMILRHEDVQSDEGLDEILAFIDDLISFYPDDAPLVVNHPAGISFFDNIDEAN